MDCSVSVALWVDFTCIGQKCQWLQNPCYFTWFPKFYVRIVATCSNGDIRDSFCRGLSLFFYINSTRARVRVCVSVSVSVNINACGCVCAPYIPFGHDKTEKDYV